MIVCPCCAGRGEIEDRAPVALTPMEFRIYDAVRRSPFGISGPRLLVRMYGDRIDGGPDTAQKAMHVTIWRMNRKLVPAGFRIAGTAPGSGSVYKMQRLA